MPPSLSRAFSLTKNRAGRSSVVVTRNASLSSAGHVATTRRLPDGPGLAYFVETSSGVASNASVKGARKPGTASRTIDSMRQLSAQLAEAERVAAQARLELAKRSAKERRQITAHEMGMLSDMHGRHHNYLRISLTERCNLRCVYCMPEDGVDLQPNEKMLTVEEIVRLTGMFVQAGVDKIRLTGGEPLVRQDLPEIVRSLNAFERIRNVGITTNGITLRRKLPKLKAAGLTHINVSLDTLKPDRFAAITRRKGLESVLMSLEAALAHGYGGRLKINCVVMRGVNEDELADFLAFTRNQELDVRFIEWMPFDDNRWKDNKFFSYNSMLDVIRSRYPDLERTLDSKNDTTKWHRVPGHKGR